MSITFIHNEAPGSELDRARGKYFNNFDWRQSYEQDTYFPVAEQA
jgi:hypothetical protein